MVVRTLLWRVISLGGTLRRPPKGHPGRWPVTPYVKMSECQTPVVRLRYPINERHHMSKSVKMVQFSLTKPKSEVPFTTLSIPLKKFKVLRSDFEDLSLRVEVLDFYKK